MLLLNDPELRDVLVNPCAFRIGARDVFAGLRILDGAKVIPDFAADIHLVVLESDAALSGQGRQTRSDA